MGPGVDRLDGLKVGDSGDDGTRDGRSDNMNVGSREGGADNFKPGCNVRKTDVVGALLIDGDSEGIAKEGLTDGCEDNGSLLGFTDIDGFTDG